MGNAISFYLGQRYGGNLFHFEWARKRLHLYAKAQAFFARWGWFSIVACRFIGPLRSTVPLIAGTCSMSPLSFHISSWASAALWASVLLARLAQFSILIFNDSRQPRLLAFVLRDYFRDHRDQLVAAL